MTSESNQFHSSLDSESQLAQIMNEYLEMLEDGCQPSRQQLLDAYPHLAEQLGPCLEGIDILHFADNSGDPELSSQTSDMIRPLATLGDFRIIRQLARGGMGVVYEAEQLSMGRKVALKVLPFAALLDERQLQRFKTEARAAGSLHHPHIVPVFSVGSERGVHYYAMQLIEGLSLAEVIQGLRSTDGVRSDDEETGRLLPSPPESETRTELQAEISTKRSKSRPDYFRTVARWGQQAAEALAYAHENGVLHRDIKPANLLLDPGGNILVADFGLARLGNDVSLTMTGEVLGTLRYMSPEQALGKRVLVDQRADVYSLGVTLYELVTTRPAFGGSNKQEVLHKIAVEELLAPRKLDAAIPADLETIILKAASKASEDRYGSAADLADDLKQFLADKPISAKPPTTADRIRKWFRRHRLAVWSMTAALLMLSLVSIAGFAWTSRKNAQLAHAVSRAERKNLEARDALFRESAAHAEATQAEQKAIQSFYLAAMRQAEDDLRRGETARFAETMVQWAFPENQADLRDWEWYYLLSRFRQETQVHYEHVAAVRDIAWHPEKNYLATVGDDAVVLWDPTRWEPVMRLGPHSGTSLAWHPNGQSLAVAHVDGKVRIWNIETGAVTHEIGAQGAFSLAYSPDGNRLAASVGGEEPFFRVWDSATYEPTWSHYLAGARCVSWSPDGQHLACGVNASDDLGIFVFDVDRDDLVLKQDQAFQHGVLDIEWNPDGSRIAVCEGLAGVKVFDAKDLALLHTAEVPSVIERIAWSPSGRQLAAGVGRNLVIYDRDLKLVAEQSGHSGYVLAIAWNADEDAILTGATDTSLRVWNLNSLRSPIGAHTICSEIPEPTNPTMGLLDKAFFSNSAKFLAVLDDAQDQLVVRRTSDGQITHRFEIELSANSGCVAWSANDEFIACAAEEEQEVVIVSLIDGSQRMIARLEKGTIRSLDWDANSSRLAAAVDVGNHQGLVNIWDVTTGRKLQSISFEQSPVVSVSWDPTSTKISTVENAGRTCLVRIWDSDHGDMLHLLTGHTRNRGVTKPVWSPDGDRLAAFSWNGPITIWNTRQGNLHGRLHGHSNAAVGEWLPSNRRFASCSLDGTLRLWDAESCEEILHMDADYQSLKFASSSDDLYLLGDSLDAIRVPIDDKELSDLMTFTVFALINRGNLEKAEDLVRSLDARSPSYFEMLRHLFEQHYWLAISIESAAKGSSAVELTQLASLGEELINADRLSQRNVREIGMTFDESIMAMLIDAANAAALRIREYKQDAESLVAPMKLIVRLVEEFVTTSESRLLIKPRDWQTQIKRAKSRIDEFSGTQ